MLLFSIDINIFNYKKKNKVKYVLKRKKMNLIDFVGEFK